MPPAIAFGVHHDYLAGVHQGVDTDDSPVFAGLSVSGALSVITDTDSGWRFSDRSPIAALTMQRLAAGDAHLEQYSFAGDGTDNVTHSLFRIGTPSSIDPRERLIFGWSGTEAYVKTDQLNASSRPLNIYTDGNTNQVYLATSGFVGINTNLPSHEFTVNGDTSVSGTANIATLDVSGNAQIHGVLSFDDTSVSIDNFAVGQLDINAPTDIQLDTPTVILTGSITLLDSKYISFGSSGFGTDASIAWDGTSNYLDVQSADTRFSGAVTTTGLGTFGSLDVDTLNLDGNVITDSTGTISFGNENLITTGNITIDADTGTGDLIIGDDQDCTIGWNNSGYLAVSSKTKLTGNIGVGTAPLTNVGITCLPSVVFDANLFYAFSGTASGATTGNSQGVFGLSYANAVTTTHTGGSATAIQASNTINNASGTWANVYGARIVGTMNTAFLSTSTVTNWYQVYVENVTKSTSFGTLGTLYGIYLEDIGGEANPAATNWAIYSLGGDSYHKDFLAFGQTDKTLKIGSDADGDLDLYADSGIDLNTSVVNFNYAGTAKDSNAASLGNTPTGISGTQTGWLKIEINGSTAYVPYWNTSA